MFIALVLSVWASFEGAAGEKMDCKVHLGNNCERAIEDWLTITIERDGAIMLNYALIKGIANDLSQINNRWSVFGTTSDPTPKVILRSVEEADEETVFN